MTDEGAGQVGTYAYDAWGNVTASSGSEANEYKFTSRRWDSAVALQYNRARFCDPAIGRFISPDPLTGGPDDPTISYFGGLYSAFHRFLKEYVDSMQPHRLNRYVYCVNSPVNLIDPLGLATWADRDGGVRKVTQDDDLSIYQWQGYGPFEGEEGPLKEGAVVDADSPWKKIGKTQFWDAFKDPMTGNEAGRVHVGDSIDELMLKLYNEAGGMGYIGTWLESLPGGFLDIKDNIPDAGVYDGFLFDDSYVTLREAGNILAGMNAAQFNMEYEDFQRGAGALHEAGVVGLLDYQTRGTLYGPPPEYGEVSYQYYRSLYGYESVKEGRWPK